MSDETFEYITTDYMISIESNEQTIQPVEYIVELGQEGIPGKQGEKGDPGFSPTVGYNLSDGHLTFTIVNEDGVTVTPDVFDYVMRKNGSNATLPFTIGNFKILSDGNVRVTNEDITGYLNVKEIRPRKSSGITIGYANYDAPINLVTDNKVYYNGAEIATRSNIGNGTVILTQGGVTKGSFSVNQSETSVIDLDAGGGAITNPLGIGYTQGGLNYSLNLGVNESTSKIISNYTIASSGSYFSTPIKLPSSNTAPLTLTEDVNGLYTIGLNYDTNTLGLDANNKLTVISGGGGSYTAGTGIDITSDVIAVDFTDVATATQGSKADTAVQPGDLATVATTGDYTDLLNKPTIPTVNNSTITFTQGGTTKGSITLNQSSDATIALDAGSSPDNPLELLTDSEGLADVTSYAHSTFDSTKVTVSGSLTISNDGIASGFSVSDYIQETLAIAGAWTVTCKFNSTDISSGIQQILNYSGYNRILIAPQGWITIFADENNATSQSFTLFSSGDIVNNNNYYLVISYDGNSAYTATLTNLDNGTTITASATNNYKLIQTSQTWLIGSERNRYLRGTFDLKYFSVTSNGVNILNYNQTGIDTYTINGSTVTIPYTLSKTGSKIVDSAYRTDVETVYNNQGYVRYYTLNEGVNYTLPTPPDKGYLPNLSWVLNNMNSTPDYSASITMDLNNSDFTAPTKGVIVLAGYTTGGTNIGGILRISINSNIVYTNATNPTGYTYFDLCLPVDSGDVINLLTITTPATINTQKFFPLKEVN